MFGSWEWIVIFVVALLVFGPNKLPEMGKTIGRAVREFRSASEEFKSSIEVEAEPASKTEKKQGEGDSSEAKQ